MNEDTQYQAALHEAGHAVMRWLRGASIGEIWIDGQGNGECKPLNERERIRIEDAILISLAGYAAETGPFAKVNLSECSGGDFDDARSCIATDTDTARIWLRGAQTAEDALQRYWDWAVKETFNYCFLIEDVATELFDKGKLSGEEVQGFLDLNCGE